MFDREKLQQIENLGSMFCTLEEIAIFLEVDIETLKKDKEAMQRFIRGEVKGKINLRRDQLHLADRNTSMATWLGKQYLDQVDKQEIDSTVGLKILEIPKRERKKMRGKK